MTKVFCIIPACNEVSRVGAVVRVARQSQLVTDGVWVVDNASIDGTAQAAGAAGAKVLYHEVPGKGGAVAYAIETLCKPEDIVLLLDADLRGLKVEHIDNLLKPVLDGGYIQSVGVRDSSLLKKLFWRFHVGLSGQRAFRASLLWEIYWLDYQGWALEVALNSICRWSPKRRKRQIAKALLVGVYDCPKSVKYDDVREVKALRRQVAVQWLKGLIRFNLAVSLKHRLQ